MSLSFIRLSISRAAAHNTSCTLTWKTSCQLCKLPSHFYSKFNLLHQDLVPLWAIGEEDLHLSSHEFYWLVPIFSTRIFYQALQKLDSFLEYRPNGDDIRPHYYMRLQPPGWSRRPPLEPITCDSSLHLCLYMSFQRSLSRALFSKITLVIGTKFGGKVETVNVYAFSEWHPSSLSLRGSEVLGVVFSNKSRHVCHRFKGLS